VLGLGLGFGLEFVLVLGLGFVLGIVSRLGLGLFLRLGLALGNRVRGMVRLCCNFLKKLGKLI